MTSPKPKLMTSVKPMLTGTTPQTTAQPETTEQTEQQNNITEQLEENTELPEIQEDLMTMPMLMSATPKTSTPKAGSFVVYDNWDGGSVGAVDGFAEIVYKDIIWKNGGTILKINNWKDYYESQKAREPDRQPDGDRWLQRLGHSWW